MSGTPHEQDTAADSLEHVIAAHLEESDTPHVELAIYGVGDSRAIAQTINEFCRRALGASVAKALFHQSSIWMHDAIDFLLLQASTTAKW